LGEALIFNGRPDEGRAYLDTATRLDPSGPGGSRDWRLYLRGLAALNDGRFEEAVQSLEKMDLRSPHTWGKFQGLQVLLSAYGHLGRAAEIDTTKRELLIVLSSVGEGGYNRLYVQRYFVFKNEEDIVRLLEGLSKAGIAEFPPGFDAKPEYRLADEEMKSLIFGHELKGRRTVPEVAEYHRITATDGSTNVLIGAQTRQGMSWTQAGALCVAYPKILTGCGVIFRNPGGTREQSNEYNFVFHDSQYQFSVVK
jgi:hypothetical protein